MKSEDSGHLKTLLFIHPDYTNPHAFACFTASLCSSGSFAGLYSLERPKKF